MINTDVQIFETGHNLSQSNRNGNPLKEISSSASFKSFFHERFSQEIERERVSLFDRNNYKNSFFSADMRDEAISESVSESRDFRDDQRVYEVYDNRYEDLAETNENFPEKTHENLYEDSNQELLNKHSASEEEKIGEKRKDPNISLSDLSFRLSQKNSGGTHDVIEGLERLLNQNAGFRNFFNKTLKGAGVSQSEFIKMLKSGGAFSQKFKGLLNRFIKTALSQSSSFAGVSESKNEFFKDMRQMILEAAEKQSRHRVSQYREGGQKVFSEKTSDKGDAQLLNGSRSGEAAEKKTFSTRQYDVQTKGSLDESQSKSAQKRFLSVLDKNQDGTIKDQSFQKTIGGAEVAKKGLNVNDAKRSVRTKSNAVLQNGNTSEAVGGHTKASSLHLHSGNSHNSGNGSQNSSNSSDAQKENFQNLLKMKNNGGKAGKTSLGDDASQLTGVFQPKGRLGMEQLFAKPASAVHRNYNYQMMKNLAKEIHHGLSEGREFLSVKLNPENLGQVKILMHQEGGRFAAKIVVENSEVKQMLESGMQDIHDILKDQGYDLTEFSVDLESGKGNSRSAADGNKKSSSVAGNSVISQEASDEENTLPLHGFTYADKILNLTA